MTIDMGHADAIINKLIPPLLYVIGVSVVGGVIAVIVQELIRYRRGLPVRNLKR